MKFLLSFAVFLSLLLISCKTSVELQPKGSVKEIVLDPKTVLVDVRSAEDFQKKSAENSINIPLDELQNNTEALQNKHRVVVFCNRGIQASKALQILKKNGVENVTSAKTVDNVIAIQNEAKD